MIFKAKREGKGPYGKGPRGKGPYKGKKKDAKNFGRKRFCRFCVDKNKTIDYKDLKTLEGFIRERGRIGSRRGSGNCAKHQRRVTRAIKQARFLALLPYTHY